MDRAPFVETFLELNDSFLKLIDSLSALRGLSAVRVYGQADRQLLSSALDVLMQNQDLERCSVYLLRDGQLCNEAGLDWSDLIGASAKGRETHHAVFAIGEGLVGLAAQTGMLQRSDNCADDSRFVTGAATPADLNIGSLISVPIKASGELLGVLNVSHPHVHFFTEGHERSLLIYANFLGQMLVNNRLLGDMEKQIGERTRQLEEALSEAEALKRRYAELSVVDELTGLHNRRFFFPEARASLARSTRYGKRFCLLLIDIDHFKNINDVYGHRVGDVVLCRAAELIMRQVREADIIARFGGEEFVIALPETTLEGAKLLAERIRGRVAETVWDIQGESINATVSIGIACLRHRNGSDTQQLLDQLIGEADRALYYGKHHGRDQSNAYDDISDLI